MKVPKRFLHPGSKWFLNEGTKWFLNQGPKRDSLKKGPKEVP